MKFRALNISYQLEASVRYAALNPKNPTIIIQEGVYEQATNTEDSGKDLSAIKTLLTEKESHNAPNKLTIQLITSSRPFDQLAANQQDNPFLNRDQILHSPSKNKGPYEAQVKPGWLVRLLSANLQAVAIKRLTAKSWWHDTPGRILHFQRNEPQGNFIQASTNQTTAVSTRKSPTFMTICVPKCCEVESHEGFEFCEATSLIVVGKQETSFEVNRCMLQAIQSIMLLLQNKQMQKETRCVGDNIEDNKYEIIRRLQPGEKRKREETARTSNFPFKKKNCQVSFGTVTDIDLSCNDQFLDDILQSSKEIREDVPKEARDKEYPDKDSSHKMHKAKKREERRLEKRKRKEKRSKQITEDPHSSSNNIGSQKIPRIVMSQVAARGRYDASHADNELDQARNILNNRAIESRKFFAESKLQEVFCSSETLTSTLQRHTRPGNIPHGGRMTSHPVLNVSDATPKHQNLRGYMQQGQRADEDGRQKQIDSSQQEYESSFEHKQPSDNFYKMNSNGRCKALIHSTITKDAWHNKTLNNDSFLQKNGQKSALPVSRTMANHFHKHIELQQSVDTHGGNDSTCQTRLGQQTTGEASFQPEYLSMKQADESQHLHSDEQTSKTVGALLPIKILCSEEFLETRGETVAELASGRWAIAANGKNLSKLPKDLIGRKIVCIDTPMLESCGIHIEASNRCGMLIISTAQLENPIDAKQIVLSLAKLAAIGRYSNIQVFICCDSEITSSITKHVVKLQFAASTSRTTSPTKVFYKTTTSTSLAASLAHTILSLPNVLDSCTNLDNVQEGLVQDRVSFLTSLLPVINVGGAIECLELAKSLLSDDCPYFEIFLKNQRLRQQMMLHAISNETRQALQPAALVQMSHVLRVVVGNEAL
jgi:hypothetical protein